MYIYSDISLDSSQNEKYYRQTDRENQNTHFYPITLFFFKNPALYEIMWKKYGRARQETDDNIIQRMRFACWIIKIRIQTHTQNM